MSDFYSSAWLPELLAPAGDMECARAAVANGADAIYFGLDRFNARLRANNFTRETLPALMSFLREYGVRGYVTMNTLIFTSEMNAALDYLAYLNDSGVDGVIIQDIGLASCLTKWKRQHPEMRIELHASTQMTLTSPQGIEYVSRFLDIQQAVLARELSLKDIEKIAKQTTIPLEVFVHGALCVAYSGQCLTSESLGQRSASRGECAQACRLPYDLIVDGKHVPLGERRYLLSPQDLCAIDRIPDLLRMGVKSFKIEGRLKSPLYVGAVTAAYRKAIDAALTGLRTDECVTDHDRYAMQMVFSRGFSTGWLDGTDHPKLTHGYHGKKRGAYVGTIAFSGDGWIELEHPSSVSLTPGDGFVIDAGEDRNHEQGGRIWKVNGKRLFFHGKASHISWNKVRSGQKLWKTDDPALNAELKKRNEHLPQGGIPITLECSGECGNPLTVRCPEYDISVQSDQTLQKAEKHALSSAILTQQLGRLGGTGFRLIACSFQLAEGVMLPLSVLNQTRRTLVEKLKESCDTSDVSRPKTPYFCPQVIINNNKTNDLHVVLAVLCRREDQIIPAMKAGADVLYLDFEELRNYPLGLQRVREEDPKVPVFLATPRIQKPSEIGFFKMLTRQEADGILVRNWGGAEYFHDSSLKKVGDFSLNITNPYSAAALRGLDNWEALTISYDLNATQVNDLLRSAPPEWFELTLHQHMPMFHTEHCVFCTFLSQGHSFSDCGQPCEHYHVQLRDRVGQLHPLSSDAGCRNTLFNGRAQTGAGFYRDFAEAGLRRFRVELLDESAEATARLVACYRSLLDGHCSARELIQTLDVAEQLGVVEGTLRPL